MDLVVTGVAVGLLGTLIMDSLNYLVARTRSISRIDVAMIGRMASGWARGRFRYANPNDMQPVFHELITGIAAHYTIGVALAVPFVVGWSFLLGDSPAPALRFSRSSPHSRWPVLPRPFWCSSGWSMRPRRPGPRLHSERTSHPDS